MNKFNLILALLYSALIIFLGLSESISSSVVSLDINDKLAHFISYLLFYYLWYNPFCYLFKSKALIYLFVFAFTFGVFIELGQNFLTLTRNAELLDVVSNLTGILMPHIYFSLKKRKI